MAALVAMPLTLPAAVTATRNGSNLATRTYPGGAVSVVPVTVTLAAEAGFTITAKLDGVDLPMGATIVSTTGYHEVYETRTNTTTNATTTSLAYQFIIASPGRGTTEMGLPISEPAKFVNDAPSAFAGHELDVIVPAKYPRNLPLPVAVRLKKGAAAGALAGDPLFLNGLVTASEFPAQPVQLKRGWGSTILPARADAGVLAFTGKVNGLTDAAPLEYEAATTWTPQSGNLTGAQAWAADSRISLDATLTVKAGATLTVGAGSVIRAAPGAEIWVEPGGRVTMNGTLASPVVVVPAVTSQPWGGVWLHQSSTATVAEFTATGTLFCCWGANQNWFTTAGVTPSRTIYSRHRQHQPCFAVGTNAVCRLTDCSLIGPTAAGSTRGAGFAMKDGNLHLTRTALQRAITGGEQEGGVVEIHSCAITEITEPGTSADDGTAFDDLDNDGIYLVPGSGHTYHLSKTVIGWTKDDGIDSGGGGSGATICDGCWFENCVHEAFSNSGTGRVPETHNGVHFNNGQGMECGYGDSVSGPISMVDHCLMVGNLTGVRYGDNYSSFGTYNGTLTVQNSYLLYNRFRDAFAMDWRAAQNWAYQDARIVSKNTKYTRADDFAHQQGVEDTPAGSLWNPASDGAGIEPFMPVPGSNVGVAFLHSGATDPLALYPASGSFEVRLSTFSSKVVTVPWQAVGKAAADQPGETVFASGTLTFQPGETLRSVTALLPPAHGFALVRISLAAPANAEVTGPDVWYVNAPVLETLTFLPRAAAGWSYYANRTPATTAQKPPADGGGRAWTAVDYVGDALWKTNKTAPIGWGNLGAAAPYLILGTTLPAGEQGITTYFRRTFQVTDPAAIRSLSLELLNDDGAVAFINGVAFAPVNVDPGTAVGGVSGIGSEKLAASTKGDGTAETVYDVLTADSSVLGALVTGTNVLTIEVHQGSATSSDAVCDAALTATLNPPGQGNFELITVGGDPFLIWDQAIGGLEESPDLNDWSPLSGAANPFPIKMNAPRQFYRIRQ